MNAIIAAAVPVIGWALTVFMAYKAAIVSSESTPGMLYFAGLSMVFYLLSVWAGYTLIRRAWRGI